MVPWTAKSVSPACRWPLMVLVPGESECCLTSHFSQILSAVICQRCPLSWNIPGYSSATSKVYYQLLEQKYTHQQKRFMVHWSPQYSLIPVISSDHIMINEKYDSIDSVHHSPPLAIIQCTMQVYIAMLAGTRDSRWYIQKYGTSQVHNSFSYNIHI